MLQQTQVKTVIPYFNNFIKHFPSVEALAQASLDDVLANWAGLGYYTRARNLHKAAVEIDLHWNKNFYKNPDDWLALSGIGRSTAAAIVSQSFDIPLAILDGNVKRVLSRYYAIEGWTGNKKIENILWLKAEQLIPKKRVPIIRKPLWIWVQQFVNAINHFVQFAQFSLIAKLIS